MVICGKFCYQGKIGKVSLMFGHKYNDWLDLQNNIKILFEFKPEDQNMIERLTNELTEIGLKITPTPLTFPIRNNNFIYVDRGFFKNFYTGPTPSIHQDQENKQAIMQSVSQALNGLAEKVDSLYFYSLSLFRLPPGY